MPPRTPSPSSTSTRMRIHSGTRNRPDHTGNLLEIIWLELAEDRRLVIHAMVLRPAFYDLLPHTKDA